jgi:hypothetical protein
MIASRSGTVPSREPLGSPARQARSVARLGRAPERNIISGMGTLLVVASVTAGACGSGDPAARGRTAGDGGAREAASAVGDDGAATTPPATWPDATLSPPPTSIECPAGSCEGAGGLEPCCTWEGACGARYLGRAGAGCVALQGEGRLDPDCPGSGDNPGCCRPDDTCGAFYTATFGCVDPQAFPDPPEEDLPCTYAR